MRRIALHVLMGGVIMVIISLFIIIFNVRWQGMMGITGLVTSNITVNTTLEVVNWTIANCSFYLYPGWNLVSFYCLPSTSRDEALQPIDGLYDSIFTYDNEEKEWKAYNPDLPSYVIQDLDTIDRKYAYWINMKQGVSYKKQGYKSIYTSIPLYVGWNLVGYPTNTTINATSGLSTLDFNITWTYNNSEKKWYYYVNVSNYTFIIMHPYTGYWVLSNKQQNWLVDW